MNASLTPLEGVEINEVWCRKRVTKNTDPQRRCYNGCNFSEETVWTEWYKIADYRSREAAEGSVTTFQTINPDREYKII